MSSQTPTKDRQIKFDGLLREVLQETVGVVNIYYEPPNGFQIKYPCIIYEKDTSDHKYADNYVYRFVQAYQVKYISKKPDNEVVAALQRKFQNCKYGRHFVMDNLHHDVVIIYY